MPTIKGKIENVTFNRSGTGAKGDWTLWDVHIDGQRFSGFGDFWQKSVGQLGEFEYTEENRTSSKGTAYVSRTLKSPSSKIDPAKITAIDQKLQIMDEKLDRILELLNTGTTEEVDPSKIPF